MQVTATDQPGNVEVTAVWQEFHDLLLGFTARRVSRLEDAEDILAEVMLRIHQHSGELAHAERIAGWVYRITRNAIADYYRKPVRRELPAGRGVDVAGPDDGSAALALNGFGEVDAGAELAGCLKPLLDRLPARHREAIMLTEFDGLTQTAAATRLGISLSGMKSRVQRARAQLKALLLDCCHVELDRRGSIVSYRPHRGSCQICGPHC